MDLSTNKRLTRICNAIDHSEWIRSMHEETLKTDEIDCTTAGMDKLKRESYRCVAYNPSCLPIERRLEKLKKWDDYLYITEGLKELLQFLENVHGVESSVNALEEKLNEMGFQINETLFRELCEGKLSARKLSCLPELDLKPMCSSTPEREMQPKVFMKHEPMLVYSPSSASSVSSISSSISSSSSLEIPPYVRQLLSNNCDNITIGPNGTVISSKALKSINWTQTGANVTRKLLMEIFDRQTLASHTLSGKPSPAFLGCNKPLKQQLDEKKVRDLTCLVTNTFNMSEKEVRQAITTKCADENKMYRQRMEKLKNKLSRDNRLKKF